MAVRVLVCGGRNYKNFYLVDEVLSSLHSSNGIQCIIQGGAKGADFLAAVWAEAEDIYCKEYMAQWKELGPSAGSIRNQQMLDEGKPDLVVAFPGGKGTADMVRRAENAGVKVIKVED